MDKRNWCSKEYFKVVGERKRHITITKLKRPDGNIVGTLKEFKKTCCAFYCKLHHA
jgi:hypothetical protein